jgi:ATP-binding cassette subfamily B (MDR/TAP) protein 1
MRDKGEGEDGETAAASERKNAGATKVPFFSMFRYAGRGDLALMAVGTVAAMVNGMGDPLMTVVFATVVETFGSSDSNTVLQRLSKVRTNVHLSSELSHASPIGQTSTA